MGSVNKQVLVGRVGNTKNTNGTVNFSVATSDYFGKGKGENGSDYGTTWHNCVAFQKTGEIASKLGVGDIVYVEGTTREETYEGKTRRQIIVNSLTTITKKNSSSTGASSTSGTLAASDDADLPF